MTQKDFEKAVSTFDDAEAFVCAAYMDGGLAVAANGPTEAVIVGAAQVIIDKAEHSNAPLHHLITASSLLYSAMLVESQRNKDEKKPEATEKAPEAAANAPSADK